MSTENNSDLLFKNSINVKSSIKKDLTIQGLVNVIKYIK